MRLTLLVFVIMALVAAEESQRVQRLADVKTILVDTLGDAPGADMLRYKIQNRLLAGKQILLVNTSDRADAILTGVGKVRISPDSYENAEAVVRLVTQDGHNLWVDETPSACTTVAEVVGGALGGIAGHSAATGKSPRGCNSAEVADRVVKRLTKAIEKDRRAIRRSGN